MRRLEYFLFIYFCNEMVGGWGLLPAHELIQGIKEGSKLSASMITGPLFKSFIESEDVWLCEPNKTRQMMTNWPAAEIMLMGSWERIVVGVGRDACTVQPLSVVWRGNGMRWRCIRDWEQPSADGGFFQFKRVISGQRIDINLIHFSFSVYFMSSLGLKWHNPII